VLVGFSGSGKSTVGRELRESFGLKLVDIDCEIERSSKRKISEIIRVEGEEFFRNLEALALQKALNSEVQVIAVGGGALLREGNLKLLVNTRVVHLAATEQTIVARVKADEERASLAKEEVVRPLISQSSKSIEVAVAELIQKRKNLYDSSAIKVWTDWIKVSELAGLINEFSKMDKQSKLIVVPFKLEGEEKQQSTVLIGDGIVSQVAENFKNILRISDKTRIGIVSDSNVYDRWGKAIEKSLTEQKFSVSSFVFEAGETSKSLSKLGELADQILDAGFTRDDLLIGVGGGVVGDLAGFLASVYMRGIKLVHVPTTIVAQVDSAIGGKTGVNLVSGKNILGTFYPADLIISDLGVLSTLPEREYRAGLAEVVKYGLIASGEFFCWLEENYSKINQRDKECLKKVVEFSTTTKVKFVTEDLKDLTGVRAQLNFGHTLGHAIEKLTGYKRFLHGEAISIGMIAALKIGESKGVTPKGLVERARNLLELFSLPTLLPEDCNFSDQEWENAIMADKKRSLREISFILLSQLGEAKVEKLGISEVVQISKQI
jgi:shikimate kinase/3-dehydroquinate synthase